MSYVILIVGLVWIKIAFIRLFMLLDKEDHVDTTADKIMMFPFTVMSTIAKTLGANKK